MHNATFNPFADIAEFHEKFGLAYDGKPRILPDEIADFRLRFMQEELDEWNKHAASGAVNHRDDIDQADYTHHLEETLDALVDLAYVLFGTAYLQGLTPEAFAEAWHRVHRANMSKVRATAASDSKRGSTLDVVKPVGWEPPSHTDLVEDKDLAK